ncbi:MAG: hypothetical protein ABII01_07440 [Candidatus Woesearchaeota archaeon]
MSKSAGTTSQYTGGMSALLTLPNLSMLRNIHPSQNGLWTIVHWSCRPVAYF